MKIVVSPNYKIEDFTFIYPNRKTLALDGINLSIESGAFLVLCGPSGCGKTTLLRQLKPSLAPHGTKTGAIFFDGTQIGELPPRDAAAKIGFVMQSPDNQIVTDKVWHELSFGLESLGCKTPEIRLRVAEMASFFGIQTWFHKPVAELSGGQKQLLALASVMALQPSVLILDEPTSQLDPIAAGEFLGTIAKINRELGVTIILTEHRLEDALPLATRVIAMDKGRIIADGAPLDVGLQLKKSQNSMLLAMPTPMRVWMACDGTGVTPITARDGTEWLQTQAIKNEIENQLELPSQKTAVELKGVWFKYEKHLPDVVKDLNFKAHYGEITTILGGNGTGKTTTLSLIAGLNKPYRGDIFTDTQAYALPQNPQSLFVAKTVREDLLEILKDQKLDKQEKSSKLASIEKLCRLEGLLENHPYDLSGGEQQRAAFAKVLLLQPKILLLDEPTKGLDAEYKQIFAVILRDLADSGVGIVLVSHDVEFCAEYADRCALFFDGNIVTENTPQAFFSGNSFYTTTANRMARTALPLAITAKDIIHALGGKLPPVRLSENRHCDEQSDEAYQSRNTPAQDNSSFKQTQNLSKRTIAAAILVLLTIPLTILIGIQFLDDRRFLFISILIISQTVLPFALVFEGRKPQAREIVVIAVLIAIAVAGRGAFFMLPQFKPILALIIIAGVSFGAESGFLVGAMSMFVSNMFFGQGPWTPWQMFAAGIIGFLAGILFRKGLLNPSPIPLAIFGGLSAFFVYGGIMSPASAIIWQPNPTREMILTAIIYGIPFNLVLAAATVFFIFLFAKPMLEKLDRIKIKYGLVEHIQQ